MRARAGTQPVTITVAVEGVLDEAVVQILLKHLGARIGRVYGRQGKPHLERSLGGYNEAARLGPWLVLLDLDSDADCAPILRAKLLATESPMMLLRIAVPEIESWLLADRERFARFTGVALSVVPRMPEAEANPKRSVVDLARRSRRRDIRADLVPRTGSGRSEGPGYTSRMIEFVLDRENGWRPEVAEENADSLRRCVAALKRLITSS
jgi:hypothetical protein